MASIDDYIPYNCRNLVVGADKKTDEEKIDILKNYIVYKTPFTSPSYEYNKIPVSEIHPVCQRVKQDMDNINKEDSDINLLYTDLKNLEDRKYNIQSDLDSIKRNYDTAILEKIANMESEALKMQQERSQKLAQLAEYNKKIQDIQAKILVNDKFKSIWEYVTGNNAEKQKLLESDFAVAEFLYPVKKLFMELAFLLPLFIVFWIWNSRSIKKSS